MQRRSNAEDLLNELDANKLAEALGLSTADAEVAGLVNLSIQLLLLSYYTLWTSRQPS